MDMGCMRGGIWKGDILVADIEELDNLDASEVHARRLDAKEVVVPKNGPRKESLRTSLLQNCCGQFENGSSGTCMGESTNLEWSIPVCERGRHHNGWEEARSGIHVEEIDETQ